MDYVTGIQRAIDYVENNLTGEICYDEAAKRACMSVFHFQRVFGLLCGMTMGDYIRARRGGRIKSFSRISVKLILIGGNTMDYRIEKRGKMKILCKRKRVRKPMDDSAVADISRFWADSGADGSIEKLCKIYPDDSPVMTFGNMLYCGC